MVSLSTEGVWQCLPFLLQKVIEEFLVLAGDPAAAGQVHSEQVRSELFLRSMVENELVPRLLAFSCLLLGAEVSIIHQEILELLRGMSTALPSEAEFLTMMSRRVDPETYAVYSENLELTQEMSWGGGELLILPGLPSEWRRLG